MSEFTVTTNLRAKLLVFFAPKPPKSMRQCARETGVSVSTISRFMQGKEITSGALDKLMEWVEKQ